MKKRSLTILLVAFCLICLTCVLCACGNKETQTTPPTGGDTPSSDGDTPSLGGDSPSTGGDTTHVHAYGSWSIIRSATCSVEGLKARRCVTCGNVETETIPKTAHTPVTDDAVEATCTQEGKTQGSHCGVCQTVLEEQQETRALGHTAGAEWFSNDDTHWHECIRCHTHMEETAHTYGMWETQSTPTIDAEGIDRQYCTCGKYHERKVDKLPPFTFVMDGTVYSVKEYLGHDSVVEVPSTYNGVTVAVIGPYAFQYQTGITDIILPETILKIGYGAFSYCTSLQNVNIPKCMTFEDLAFDNCTSLKEIVMPDNLTSCGKIMFNNCTALTKVTFTGGVVDDGLSYNNTVQEIIVEDGVKSVARHAFSGCSGLKHLTLPRIESSATSFAEYYFGVTPQTYTYNYTGIDAYTDKDQIEPQTVDIYSMNGKAFEIPRSGCDWYVNSNNLWTVTYRGMTYKYTNKPIKVAKWYNWYDSSVGMTYDIPWTWIAEYSYLPNIQIEKLTITNQMISRYDSVFDNCSCKLDIWQKFPIKQLSVTGNSSPFVDEFNEEDYTLVAEHTDGYVGRLPLFDYVDEDDKAIAGELGQHQLIVTYLDASIEYALEILLHQFDDAVFNSHEFIFDGEAKYMSADMLTGLPEGTDVVFDGDGQSELGHYEVTATLSKQYYESKTLTATMDIFPPTFSLTYMLGIDEATHENPSDYQTNGDGVELAAATLAGFGFVDWYTEPEFTNKITKIEGNAHQDYTLYAKWQLPFDITDGSIKVNAFGKKQTEIVIPNRVYDQTITAIASEAFKGCTSLKAVTIGDGVTSIGEYAFSGCTGITKVNYLGDLKGWCEIEFGSSSANPLYVGNNVKLYLNDEEVTEVKDLDGLEYIPAYAFSGCTGITSVTIPDSVQSIGSYAFSGCTGLRTLTIGAGVESIGNSAFSGCTGLKSFIVAEGNAIYQSKDGVLYKKEDKSIYLVPSAIEGAVTILDGCTNITGFSNRTGLLEITIPDSMTSIGNSAFYGCTGLQTLTIGAGVESIGNSAFSSCTGLKSFNVAEGNSVYQSKDGVLYKKEDKSIYQVPDAIEGAVAILDGCTSITGFGSCTGLSEITIPDSVTSIGGSAFYYCTGLQTVNWNATNCTVAGSNSYPIFKGCTKLTTVNIGENVQSIPAYAFYDCRGLKEITIPGSVTSIGKSAFSDCYGLKSFNVAEGNSVYQSKDGVLYKKEDKSIYLVPYKIKGAVAILEGCTNITGFGNRTGLSEITIPDSVTSIDGSAFYGCTGLSEITIPDSVTSIGRYAFKGCTGLQTVMIGENVESIGEEAFYGCTLLQTVTIPDSVTSIGNSAFYGCTGLQTVNWNATNCTETGDSDYPIFKGCTKLTTVNIGGNVQSIPAYAFDKCTNITKVNYLGNLKSWCEIAFGNLYANPLYEASNNQAGTAKLYMNDEEVTGDVNIPSGTTKIGKFAFSGLKGITSVTIPDSVISIGEHAFQYCTGLQTVTIGEGVQSIGEYAFYGCKGITRVNYLGGFKDWCEIEFEKYAANPLYYGNAKLYCNGEVVDLIKLNIPVGTTKIGIFAFSGLKGITSVTIPDSVTSIGDFVFDGCTGLAEITIPDSVTSIGRYAFSGCTGLQSVTIGNGVQEIDSGAFYNCSGLQSVTIGKGVTSIGERAFEDCKGLKDIYYVGDETQWESITKGYRWNQYYSSGSYYTISYRMHYNATGPEAASNISALPSDQPVFIACDKLDLWVKQD